MPVLKRLGANRANTYIAALGQLSAPLSRLAAPTGGVAARHGQGAAAVPVAGTTPARPLRGPRTHGHRLAPRAYCGSLSTAGVVQARSRRPKLAYRRCADESHQAHGAYLHADEASASHPASSTAHRPSGGAWRRFPLLLVRSRHAAGRLVGKRGLLDLGRPLLRQQLPHATPHLLPAGLRLHPPPEVPAPADCAARRHPNRQGHRHSPTSA